MTLKISQFVSNRAALAATDRFEVAVIGDTTDYFTTPGAIADFVFDDNAAEELIAPTRTDALTQYFTIRKRINMRIGDDQAANFSLPSGTVQADFRMSQFFENNTLHANNSFLTFHAKELNPALTHWGTNIYAVSWDWFGNAPAGWNFAFITPAVTAPLTAGQGTDNRLNFNFYRSGTDAFVGISNRSGATMNFCAIILCHTTIDPYA